jgi:hypothetical protein
MGGAVVACAVGVVGMVSLQSGVRRVRCGAGGIDEFYTVGDSATLPWRWRPRCLEGYVGAHFDYVKNSPWKVSSLIFIR